MLLLLSLMHVGFLVAVASRVDGEVAAPVPSWQGVVAAVAVQVAETVVAAVVASCVSVDVEWKWSAGLDGHRWTDPLSVALWLVYSWAP